MADNKLIHKQKAVFILKNVLAKVKPRPRHSAFMSKERLSAITSTSSARNVSVPVHTYMPEPYKLWCEEIGWTIKNQANRQGWKFVKSGAISISLDIEQIKARGDVDNISGAFLDAIQGALFADDSQVVELHCKVRQNQNNRIVVQICEVSSIDREEEQAWAEHALSLQEGARKGRRSQRVKK